ncbi:DUF2231 domain-containing protein [Mesorhizobium sp. CAU 1741]|uniref:DUF2231 domain-containing protein n=1 Tax=Mesorhizobium sp. CAU 1741 TaxID=3140366 RepID=UPI00325BDDDB
MAYDHPIYGREPAFYPVHAALLAFPVACFSLTLVSDIAYWRTLNLLWLHFSEWLLLAGLVFGVAAWVARMLDRVVRRISPSWPAAIGGVVVLLLATLNSFIHTADGWTAVVPYGLAVSFLTVIAMIITAWLGRKGAYHA